MNINEMIHSLAVLKEEVDDLSHLAPTPGEACIPLDESSSFLASYEELNDLIDNYIYGDGGNVFEQAETVLPTTSTALQAGQTDSYFADEPAESCGEISGGNGGEELTKPLLKDAIIIENVFAAARLTVGNIMQHQQDELMCEGGGGGGVAVANEKKMDPFITYRDESSDTSHLLSPDDCSAEVSQVDGGWRMRMRKGSTRSDFFSPPLKIK